MFEAAVETLPWDEQARLDDGLYRRQISYLLEHSRFYRDKLGSAGIASAAKIGGLDAIAKLPFTEKSEIRASCDGDNPIGSHLCVAPSDIVRIYSTSGTTGTPSYIPLTSADLDNWVTTSARSYAAAGISRGEGIVTTYNAGPFVAGAALAAFDRLGMCHIPVGTGNTERLMTALRARLEEAWGAKVTEAMGIGDIGVSLWGECEQQRGMHLGGRGFVHAELIDPETGAALAMADGAKGELVLTHLRHRAAPLLRFRTRDHVQVWTSPCKCGRTAPRVRCIGRTDDMLIVRGVNVFPSALRQAIGEFMPAVSGMMVVKPAVPGVRQEPPLPVAVELAKGSEASPGLAEAIGKRIREVLAVSVRIELVPWGSLQRSEYKSKLVQH